MNDPFERIDQPFGSLTELLEGILQALLDRLGLEQVAVVLADGTQLSARRELRAGKGRTPRGRGDPRSVDDAVRAAEWLQASDGTMRRRTARKPAETVLPLAYAGRNLGALRMTWRQPGGRPSDTALKVIARRSSRLVHRYQARDWAARALGAPLVIVGMSRALQEAEALLEAVAASDLSVLVEAELGTEAAHFAAMIHAGGRRREHPFVPIHCADAEGAPADWLKKAKGGTLFLDAVEALRPDLQAQLARHLRPGLSPGPPLAATRDVRIIAATATDLRQEVAAGRFARSLLWNLDVLSLRVPPLRERSEDVPALVSAALARCGFDCEAKRTSGLMALFEGYAWPENLVELERVVLRLAVMTGDQPIQAEDVVRLTPWIAPAWRSPSAETAAFRAAREAREGAAPGRGERWVRSVLERDVHDLARLHEGLRRALLWLADHAAEPITLDQLAREAHVSPSHLTFLFRTSLGVSFKSLLTRLRVERAKQIFSEATARRVTEVAMTVGFSDLSHFERTFRRLVGQSPREFRRAAEAAAG